MNMCCPQVLTSTLQEQQAICLWAAVLLLWQMSAPAVALHALHHSPHVQVHKALSTGALFRKPKHGQQDKQEIFTSELHS